MTRLRAAVPFALLVAACGVKGAPLAPELVQPEPPANLAAIATPEGIRLSWTRPLHYQGGKRMNDLGGFAIERAPADGAPADFARVGTVEIQDRERFRKERAMEWLDRDVTRGTRYLYRVDSFTLDGYTSTPAGPVVVRFGPPAQEPPP